ncbi:hypothetical protein [Pseudomonas sp. NPDC089569]|uniref:hypothetical protein n=1 Tax=Pseudomonas sp. NPDC089569 TaxID=3390722 RepID=UPI003D077B31
MRAHWFMSFLLISLGTLLLVCFAVDGVVLNLVKFSAVAQGFPLNYWNKCIGVGLIGTVGCLLLVAKKHPVPAALAISVWWLPVALPVFTLIASLFFLSPNRVAVMVGLLGSLGFSIALCLLLGQLLVGGFLFASNLKSSTATGEI